MIPAYSLVFLDAEYNFPDNHCPERLGLNCVLYFAKRNGILKSLSLPGYEKTYTDAHRNFFQVSIRAL